MTSTTTGCERIRELLAVGHISINMSQFSVLHTGENRILETTETVVVDGDVIAQEGENIFYNRAKARAVRESLSESGYPAGQLEVVPVGE